MTVALPFPQLLYLVAQATSQIAPGVLTYHVSSSPENATFYPLLSEHKVVYLCTVQGPNQGEVAVRFQGFKEGEKESINPRAW